MAMLHAASMAGPIGTAISLRRPFPATITLVAISIAITVVAFTVAVLIYKLRVVSDFCIILAMVANAVIVTVNKVSFDSLYCLLWLRLFGSVRGSCGLSSE